MQVTFVDHRGARQAVAAEPGASLMESALAGGVTGILADCGGSCACATCHVHVAQEWWPMLPPIGADEEALLEMAIDPDSTSRLSCQIRLVPALDGLIVTLPARQV